MILCAYTVFFAETPDSVNALTAEPAVMAVNMNRSTEKNITGIKAGQTPAGQAHVGQNPSGVVPSGIVPAGKVPAEYYYNVINSIFKEEPKIETLDTVYAVPWQNSDFKAYMPYDSITDKTAPQWHYRQNAWTDSNGLRRVDSDYLVAMGTYYTEKVGERFKITLDTGNVFTVTVGDIKNPAHTDRYNMYTSVKDNYGNFYSANVVEFIVDTDRLDSRAKKLGTVSCLDGLDGNIEKIEKIAEDA
jgi:hypothetical protein